MGNILAETQGTALYLQLEYPNFAPVSRLQSSPSIGSWGGRLGLPSRAGVRESCSAAAAPPPAPTSSPPGSAPLARLRLEAQVYLEARSPCSVSREPGGGGGICCTPEQKGFGRPGGKGERQSRGTMAGFSALGLLSLCQLLATASAQVRNLVCVSCSRRNL